MAALGVPDRGALGTGKYDKQRVVIVSRIFMHGLDSFVIGRGVDSECRSAVGSYITEWIAGIRSGPPLAPLRRPSYSLYHNTHISPQHLSQRNKHISP